MVTVTLSDLERRDAIAMGQILLLDHCYIRSLYDLTQNDQIWHGNTSVREQHASKESARIITTFVGPSTVLRPNCLTYSDQIWYNDVGRSMLSGVSHTPS